MHESNVLRRYLIWIGSDQEKTFGPTISGLVQSLGPDRVTLWDSKKRGLSHWRKHCDSSNTDNLFQVDDQILCDCFKKCMFHGRLKLCSSHRTGRAIRILWKDAKSMAFRLLYVISRIKRHSKRYWWRTIHNFFQGTLWDFWVALFSRLFRDFTLVCILSRILITIIDLDYRQSL